MGKPAARVMDPVSHPLPPVLTPGPGAPNVSIGFFSAWRGLPLAAVAALQAAKAVADTSIKVAQAATTAAAGTPGLPAAKAAEEAAKTAALASMSATINAMAAGGTDIHFCATPFPLPPHGPGVVINGSSTVLINNLPACRQGDTILEAIGPTNKISMGCLNVQIGMSGGSVSTGLGAGVDALASQSSTLSDNLRQLQQDGWKIRYGDAGKGSYADRAAKEIVIDSNERGNTEAIVQTLAHESGHALYEPDAYVPPAGLTKQEYVDRNTNNALKDEGEATMTNADVRKELNDAGASDIGIAGAQGDKYQEIADKYPDPADRDKARQEIGDAFADGEHPSTDPSKTYGDYYGQPYSDWWDTNVGP